MLQEHWASTVIFIGIFSQCGLTPVACNYCADVHKIREKKLQLLLHKRHGHLHKHF